MGVLTITYDMYSNTTAATIIYIILWWWTLAAHWNRLWAEEHMHTKIKHKCTATCYIEWLTIVKLHQYEHAWIV